MVESWLLERVERAGEVGEERGRSDSMLFSASEGQRSLAGKAERAAHPCKRLSSSSNSESPTSEGATEPTPCASAT